MRTSTDLRRLKREFDAADPHSLGYIGPPELRNICQQRGLIATEEQVRAMLLTMDSNSDGKISFREFCAFHHKFADPGKASKLSPFLQESVNRRSTGTVPRPFTAPPAPVASRTGGIQPQVTTSYAVLTARFRIPGECCWFTCLCAYVCMDGWMQQARATTSSQVGHTTIDFFSQQFPFFRSDTEGLPDDAEGGGPAVQANKSVAQPPAMPQALTINSVARSGPAVADPNRVAAAHTTRQEPQHPWVSNSRTRVRANQNRVRTQESKQQLKRGIATTTDNRTSAHELQRRHVQFRDKHRSAFLSQTESPAVDDDTSSLSDSGPAIDSSDESEDADNARSTHDQSQSHTRNK